MPIKKGRAFTCTTHRGLLHHKVVGIEVPKREGSGENCAFVFKKT